MEHVNIKIKIERQLVNALVSLYNYFLVQSEDWNDKMNKYYQTKCVLLFYKAIQ
jgi:hypothetical protein